MNNRKSPTAYRNISPTRDFIRNDFLHPTPSHKRDLFSSNEESTKEENQNSHNHPNFAYLMHETDPGYQIQKAFLKSKHEKNKQISSQHARATNDFFHHGLNKNMHTKSDKQFNFQKPLPPHAAKAKRNGNQGQHDYFDNKYSTLRGIKSKPKPYPFEKLSDSGDSGGSYSSVYSAFSEGDKIKQIQPRKYENMQMKKSPGLKNKDDDSYLFPSHHQPYSNNKHENERVKNIHLKHKNSGNAFRAYYQSPPVPSKNNTNEEEIHEINKKYSPQKNALPNIIGDILNRKKNREFDMIFEPAKIDSDRKGQEYDKYEESKSPMAKKRSSLTPQNKLKSPPQKTAITPGLYKNPNLNPNLFREVPRTPQNKYQEDMLETSISKRDKEVRTPGKPLHQYHKSDGCMQRLFEGEKKGEQVVEKEEFEVYTPHPKRETMFMEDNSWCDENFITHRNERMNSISSHQNNMCFGNSRISSVSSNLFSQSRQKRLLSQQCKVISLFSVSPHKSLLPFNFYIFETLAKNQNTSTFKCIEQSSGLIYCLKKSLITPENHEQLALEHKIGTKLNHPNLVKSFCSFYDRNHIYLLMEYMESGNLLTRSVRKDESSVEEKSHSPFKMIEKGGSKEKKNKQRVGASRNRIISTLNKCILEHLQDKKKVVREILQQILEGVAYLHKRNIWHRDLKPDNIFITNGTYKIGDFGSSCFDGNQEHVGTLDYAAPQILLKACYDSSVDIWSVGCIAYELETGETPFYHPDRNETIRRIVNLNYKPELVKDIVLRELISMMLVREGRVSARRALNHSYFQQMHTQSRMRI